MSVTLEHILEHWAQELKFENGRIDLPFNIEKFCSENDKLRAQLAEAREVIEYSVRDERFYWDARFKEMVRAFLAKYPKRGT